MGGFQQVEQLDDRRLRWVAEIAGVRREWVAPILKQVRDTKVAWAATEGATNAGAVYFAALGPARTRVDTSLPPPRQGSVWACQDAGGVGPRLSFQRVPEGKAGKNRMHLDVRVGVGLTGPERVSALEGEAARLEALGARRLHLLPADGVDES